MAVSILSGWKPMDVRELFSQHHKTVVGYTFKFGFGLAALKVAEVFGGDISSIISIFKH
jgi:hypothetical protein